MGATLTAATIKADDLVNANSAMNIRADDELEMLADVVRRVEGDRGKGSSGIDLSDRWLLFGFVDDAKINLAAMAGHLTSILEHTNGGLTEAEQAMLDALRNA